LVLRWDWTDCKLKSIAEWALLLKLKLSSSSNAWRLFFTSGRCQQTYKGRRNTFAFRLPKVLRNTSCHLKRHYLRMSSSTVCFLTFFIKHLNLNFWESWPRSDFTNLTIAEFTRRRRCQGPCPPIFSISSHFMLWEAVSQTKDFYLPKVKSFGPPHIFYPLQNLGPLHHYHAAH